MEQRPTPHDTLLARYLSDEASAAERREVELWLADNPEHWAELERLRRLWEIGVAPSTESFQTEAAWSKVKARIQDLSPTEDKPPARILRMRYTIMAVAASVTILIGLFFVWKFTQRQTLDYAITAQAADEMLSILLPDSSNVDLMPHSTLKYVPGFAGKERSVWLDGEARFSVRKNPDQPFVVEAGEAFVRVLGTVFQVNTRIKANETRVRVEEGRVLLSAMRTDKAQSDSSAVELRAGQEGLLLKGGKARVNLLEAGAAAFEFDQTLVFENTELDRVCQLLSDRFHTSVQVAPPIAGCRLTATFQRQSLREILEIIATTLQLELIETKGQFQFNGDAC